MHITFVDVTRDFGLSTPLESPMGGTQSAVCYLAKELITAGHQVTIANGTPAPRVDEGARLIPWQQAALEREAGADAIIFVLAHAKLIALWHKLRDHDPVWLQWCHHDVDQPGVAHLKTHQFQELLDGIIVVSEWQALRYRETFGINWDKVRVLRNGVSPAFLNLFSAGSYVLAAKDPDPLLIYTSTPFRGLSLLLDAVPLIRQQVPNAKFRIFSSLQIYGYAEGEENLKLYQRCHDLDGVEYMGSCGQTQLAAEMKRAWCLAYPNIFPETSCISVMEALSAGCKIVTTHSGALPETTAGFAAMIINPADHKDHVERFARATIEVLKKMSADRVTTERELQGAVAYAHARCSWRDRVEQLTEWIAAKAARRRAAQACPP